MNLKKSDFIEAEFTGKLDDGQIFDSNIQKDIEKAGLKTKAKPFIFSLGQGMFLKGVDDFLIGKELGKHKIELQAKDAFGLRNPKLIQLIPMKIFKQHNVNPFPGAVFNFDGKIARVLSVSGGRIRVDFNNPLAGKDVVYEINIKRKIEDLNERINSFSEFLFKKKFDFKVKEKKLTMNVEKPFVKFVEMFKDKFKEIFSLELEVKEMPAEKQTNAKAKGSKPESKE